MSILLSKILQFIIIKLSFFRQLANLGKKTDERLTLYYDDFKKMCERVVRKRSPRPGQLLIRCSHMT